jgi:hypothetical protein
MPEIIGEQELYLLLIKMLFAEGLNIDLRNIFQISVPARYYNISAG